MTLKSAGPGRVVSIYILSCNSVFKQGFVPEVSDYRHHIILLNEQRFETSAVHGGIVHLSFEKETKFKRSL